MSGALTCLSASPLCPSVSVRPGWRWYRLTDLAKLATGHTPSRRNPEYWDGDIPWLQLPDIRALDGRHAMDTSERINQFGIDNSAAVLLPKGTVCMSRTASVGFVTVMGRSMATSQDFVNWGCGATLDPDFLMHLLIASRQYIRDLGSGAVHHTIYFPTVEAFSVCIPPVEEQQRIVTQLTTALAPVDTAQCAAQDRLAAAEALSFAYIRESLDAPGVESIRLGDCLEEIRQGVGASWNDYPLIGATRSGLAPAKEAIGKRPERYKLVERGTVFYNPMRILLGSIAMVDEDDAPGITSPDYVVFRGRTGRLDSRWFYRWFRSIYGEQLIRSLSRGAVRERILFNRLAEGEIDLPPYSVQVDASRRILALNPILFT